MNTAESFIQSIETIGDDVEMQKATKDFFLRKHTISHYKEDGRELFFFKDHSIFEATRIDKDCTQLRAFSPEDATQYALDLLKSPTANEE